MLQPQDEAGAGEYIMSVKPLEQEAEYVASLEYERRKQALLAQASRAAEAERQRVLGLAQNHCPRCGTPLVPVVYRSIAIDRCSHCQGGWLDCGNSPVHFQKNNGFSAP
jgi:hypothetical protein